MPRYIAGSVVRTGQSYIRDNMASNAIGLRIHDRPQYSRDEAEVVAAWLNGADIPLGTMRSRDTDPWDPVNRHETRARPSKLFGGPGK